MRWHGTPVVNHRAGPSRDPQAVAWHMAMRGVCDVRAARISGGLRQAPAGKGARTHAEPARSPSPINSTVQIGAQAPRSFSPM